MTLRTLATGALALGGMILIGMGLWFVFLRPALLPEDARYMGSTVAQIQDILPRLAPRGSGASSACWGAICSPPVC